MEFKIYTMAEIHAVSIFELREFAKEIGVRAPTMFTKEQLENAVYEKLQQIDKQRKAPVELLSPRSRVGIINKSLIPEEERGEFGPFKKLSDDLELKKFEGFFRPFENGDGLISRRLVPTDDDMFISQNFVEGVKLVIGDRVCGEYVDGKDDRPASVARVTAVNGKKIDEHRAADILYSEKRKPYKSLKLWSEDFSLRSLSLSGALMYGSRVLLTHGTDCALTELNLCLADALEDMGMRVLPLFLGVLPEYVRTIDERGATACAFDIEERYARKAVELLVEAACRAAEEGEDVAVIVDNLEAIADSDTVRKMIGCACALDKGSITVFASANEEIMDMRSLRTAESVSDMLVRFVSRRGKNCVDFRHCLCKRSDADWILLDRLSEIEGEAVDAIVRNCPTREDAERLLK